MAFESLSAEAGLIVEGLSTGYGRIPVLRNLSLTMAPGERLGMLGPNGAGKTTLLQCLMGYLPATGGRIILDGTDITNLTTTQRAKLGIGYVPQGRAIFSRLTVHQNLRMGCRLHPEREGETIDRVLVLFPRLTAYLDRLGGSLSGGEQQLLALARCMCTYPRIVLLDEPTEGIQPSILAEMADALVTTSRERGFAMLLVEQKLDFLAQVSERVIQLNKGELIAL